MANRRKVDQAQIDALLQDSDSDDSPAEMEDDKRLTNPKAGGFDPENFVNDLVNADSTEFGRSAGRRNDNRTAVATNLPGADTDLKPSSYPKLRGEYIVSSDSSSEDNDDEEVKDIVGDQLGKIEQIQNKGGKATKPQNKQAERVSKDDLEFYTANMGNREVREKFITNILDSDGSSEDDDSVGSDELNKKASSTSDKFTLANPIKQIRKQSTLERQKNDLLAKADLVTLIENNEKQGEFMPEKLIEQASQLLSFDKEFYNVKKELLLYSQFQQISQMLYEDTNHPYYGVVSCIKMFRAKNGTVIFVGNSSGYIRVFDIQTQKQMKPLYDDALFQNKVTCIDISEDGHYLLAGYKKGTLVLWDSNKYKMARIMKDVAKSEQSEFSQVKILYVTEKDVITIVTAEESGRIRLVHVTKGSFFDRYTHQANSLYEADLKGVATISVQRPSSMAAYYSPYCDQSCLVAYGATNVVSLCEMRQFPPKPLMSLKRPTFCKEKSVPYIDWGYGLTPMNRERTLPLMAIAWDKIIQLVYVDDDEQTLAYDGYYCSEQEINQVYFMGDSVVVILVNQEEIKVLYTEKFQPGECRHLELANEDILVNNVFKESIEGTKASELEKGYKIHDIKTGVVTYRPTDSAAPCKVMNFNNSISQFKKNIIFICQNKIMRARLLSWREFIDKLKFTDNQDWLTVLKVSLEIYNGEIKGFAMLPDARERRQNFLKDYMRKLIMTSIQTVIYKYNTKTSSEKSGSTGLDTNSNEDSSDEKQFSIEEIAIKVSIEFCLNIQEVNYLFTDIYDFFIEKELKDKFTMLLCPAIISGQFRNEHIPETILRRLIDIYEQKKEFKILEKVIQQLNLSHYQDTGLKSGIISMKIEKESIRDRLEVVCQTHCLVSALLYLFTSDSKDKGGCQQILNMMLNNLEEKKNLERLQERNSDQHQSARKITKDDIRLLRSIDKERKYEIEKSHLYIGYKLLWIIKMFLDGRKFPNGDLENSQWRMHVYHIVDFVTNEDYLKEMLDFDPEQFFKIMTKLFLGKPWEYLSNCEDHSFEFQKNPDLAVYIKQASSVPMQILEIFKQASERATNKQKILSEACFQELVLKILVGQKKEYDEKSKIQARNPQEIYQKIELEYDLIYKAMRSAFSDKKTSHDSLVKMLGDNDMIDSSRTFSVDEQLIIDTLKTTTFEPEHIDEIIKLIQETHLPLVNIKIQLYENKKDYVEAFMQHLNQAQQKKHVVKTTVFKWLEEKLNQLNEDEAEFQSDQQPSEEHKTTAHQSQTSQLANPYTSHSSLEFLDQEQAKVAMADSDEEIDEAMSGENAILDLSDDEGEENKKNKAKKPDGWIPYPPLQKLKAIVKDRMLDLAQLSTDETIQLINQHFDEGEYQEHLIMRDFSKFPETQLNYLESYVTKNEKDIENTIGESAYQHEKQKITQKYESYLVQFTRLLCQYDKNNVEYWVSKTYFPINQCLEVCRAQENDRGVAILVMRSGDYLQAIKVYLSILDKISVQKLLDQIKLNTKDKPNFLQGLDSESQKKTVELTNWKMMAQFDQILGKAGGICLRDDVERYTSQEGWFLILEYLQNYMIASNIKCNEALKNAVQQMGNTKYSSINEKNKQEYIDRLKQFIIARINYILKFPGLDISLEQIIQRLNLTFEQIQQLCTSKLKHNNVTMNIENIQRQIIMNNLTDMFKDYTEKKGRGWVIELKKKQLMTMQAYKSPAGRRFKRNTICSKCFNSIKMAIQAVPIVVFVCNHQYHKACLDGKHVCPLCSKLDFAAIKQEQEDRKALNQRNRRRRQSAQSDTDNESVSNRSESAERFTIPTDEEQKEKVIKKSRDLTLRGLEIFDKQQEDEWLKMANFEECYD